MISSHKFLFFIKKHYTPNLVGTKHEQCLVGQAKERVNASWSCQYLPHHGSRSRSAVDGRHTTHNGHWLSDHSVGSCTLFDGVVEPNLVFYPSAASWALLVLVS